MPEVFLSLGTNLGNRESNLREALNRLEAGGATVTRLSSVYETEPVGLTDQPEYLNLVCAVETALGPDELLDAIHVIERVVDELLPAYGADCPAAVVWRASWPDERVLRGTLGGIGSLVRAEGLERTALILVGRALGATDFRDSALYSADYDRRFRPRAGKEPGV